MFVKSCSVFIKTSDASQLSFQFPAICWWVEMGSWAAENPTKVSSVNKVAAGSRRAWPKFSQAGQVYKAVSFQRDGRPLEYQWQEGFGMHIRDLWSAPAWVCLPWTVRLHRWPSPSGLKSLISTVGWAPFCFVRVRRGSGRIQGELRRKQCKGSLCWLPRPKVAHI